MRISPTLLALGAGILLLASGCNARQDTVLLSELRAENARLTQELNALQETARNLEVERNYLQEENIRLREQAEGLAQQLKKGIKPDEVGPGFTANAKTGGITADQDMFFKLGSAEITKQGEAALGRLAQLLNSADYRDTEVIIEGHTDNIPVSRRETVERFGDNWGLSAMRAASVVRTLQAKGVDAKRLRGNFVGEYRPAVRNNSPENRAKNRRVEIYLTLGDS